MATVESNQLMAPTAFEVTPEQTRKRRSQTRIIFDRFIRNKAAIVGLVVLGLLVLMALLGPVFDHWNPDVYDIQAQTALPSLQHPLGTDDLGRDELVRLFIGIRTSLLIGVSSMLVMLAIGITFGALAGYYGGWVDTVLMRITDAFLAIPYLIWLFVIGAIFSDGSVLFIVIVIAIFSWATPARIIRGEFLSLKEREFLLAARTLGASDFRLMFKHILPNAIGPITVAATLYVGFNIIAESILSFFGFGLQPPLASLGTMLNNSQSYITSDPLLVWVPGLAILVIVLCFNLIGDGLRDALDPYMTER